MTEKIFDFCKKHIETIGITILACLSIYLLFFFLGSYHLIDIDETRYVGISYKMLQNHDWATPILNGAPFLEKPPLYFWLNVLVFKYLGVVNDLTGRLATAILALFAVWSHFFFSKKMLNTKYAITSSIVLLSSLWFLLFSHVAILDFGFMFFTMITTYVVVLSLFCENEKNKKYFWWTGYILMALSVLMKGFIGIIVPGVVVFFMFLFMGKIKEIFKPINMLPGILLFLLVAVPWHYAVYQANGKEWVDMYIIKHHFARFMDSGMGLGRKQPFWFYIPIVIGGALPWCFNLIAGLVDGIKSGVKEVKEKKKFSEFFNFETNEKKLLLFGFTYLITVFLFFSSSSTKLPSYILTVFPALAILIGYYWYKYLECGKFECGIKISTYVTSGLFLLIGFSALIISTFFPQVVGVEYLSMVHSFLCPAIVWFIFIGFLMLISTLKDKKVLSFLTYPLFMMGVVYLAFNFIIPFTMTFGQFELEDYALYAKQYKGANLVTFDFPAKYSVMNKFDKDIFFMTDKEDENLANVIKESEKNKTPLFVIVKNKNFVNYENEFSSYKTIKQGKKYTLLQY